MASRDASEVDQKKNEAATEKFALTKIKILHDFEMRKGAGAMGIYEIYSTTVSTPPNDIRSLTTSINNVSKLKTAKTYAIRGISKTDHGFRITENMKIYQTKEFVCEAEKTVLEPSEVKIKEALVSPRKRRLSVSGKVQGVSPELTTKYSRRRILTLKDSASEATIDIKLWNQKSTLETPIGAEVVVKNVLVDLYQGVPSLNSTPLTEIVNNEETKNFNGIIDAADMDSDSPSIIIDGEEYTVPFDLLKEVYPDGFTPDVKVHLEVKGTTVLQIMETSQEESAE